MRCKKSNTANHFLCVVAPVLLLLCDIESLAIISLTETTVIKYFKALFQICVHTYRIYKNGFKKLILIISLAICIGTDPPLFVNANLVFDPLTLISYSFHQDFSFWLSLIVLILSNDIETNPGDLHHGFLTFCNWNINSLSKDNFQRVSLLEAQNSLYNYDIISLCEVSLNSNTIVPDKLLDGYKFVSCNSLSGKKQGGVGIFYKESLPIVIRHDLSFNECIVAELKFGRKRIFFTVLYRNPACKADSPEFEKFLADLENLYKNMIAENPYTILIAGDFN